MRGKCSKLKPPREVKALEEKCSILMNGVGVGGVVGVCGGLFGEGGVWEGGGLVGGLCCFGFCWGWV